ncbi:TetR/AcrR family transcriptional regulator C-terminal domain-containing protein [Streptomyces sp. NPDC059788]|uniref:TetR/AcrR family transcriptional regulator C-terminal domain-containing protein n=1 Tax=Streptomyces sp. NPDC059788 TaxID=3346948 RepID=UPI003657585E
MAEGQKRARGARAGLSRERVLDAALALIDRDGLPALSMRRLGAELGVEAMTLYHYVPNKDALLDGLVERVFESAAPLTADGGRWQAALEEYAGSLRDTLLRHPGVLPLAMSRPAVTPQTLGTVEHGLRMLRDAGFPLGRALDVLNALTVFVIGHTAVEAATARADAPGAPGSTAYLAQLDVERFPLLVEAGRGGHGADDAARFRYAVRALLAGFDATPR